MKAMGSSMNKGNWRVHIPVRNETPIHPWTKRPIGEVLVFSRKNHKSRFFQKHLDFSKNIPVFEVVNTNLNPWRQSVNKKFLQPKFRLWTPSLPLDIL